MKEYALHKTVNLESILKDLQGFEKAHSLNGTLAIAQGRNIVYEKSFGMADFEANTPCTSNTQYNIASVTKQFTAAALLHLLYDANSSVTTLQTALQTPLSYYLPPDDFIWNGIMPKWAKIITLHHLLTHTSGIVNYTDLDFFWKNLYVSEDSSMIDLVNLFKLTDLNFEPGTQYEYCNSGYVLLGQVIERLSKENLSLYLMKTFFKPLEMRDTALPISGTTPILKKLKTFFHLARGYTYGIIDPAGPFKELKHYWSHSIDAGDGGIISTAPDLIKWNNALHKGHVLPFDILELMLAPYNLIPTEPNSFYGYGIVCRKSNVGNIYTHGGSVPGYLSYPIYIPSIDVTIVSLSNLSFDDYCIEDKKQALKDELSCMENTMEKERQFQKLFATRYPEVQEIIETHSLFKVNNIKGL
ncbi:MAG: beta-lactamase family protein [Alphaproteobacteria bacterium]|nr:beta-lactamase family protein [Alphaproteobacteria bacterium]